MNRRVRIVAVCVLTGLFAVAIWLQRRSFDDADIRTNVAATSSDAKADVVSTSATLLTTPELSDRESAPSPHAAEAPQERRELAAQIPERAPAAPALTTVAADLQARAKANDARAAFDLSRMHEACSIAQGFVGKEGFEVEALMMRMGFAPDVAQMVLQRFSDRATECSKWMPGDFDHFSAHLEMEERAAALGHPVARALAIRMTAENGSVTFEDARGDRRRAMVALLETGDPTWLADIGFAISLANGAYRQEAYTLAACQLQAACAQDLSAYALQQMSPDSVMGGLSYAGLLMLSRRERQIAEAQAREIVEHWNARRFDLLIPSRP